VSGVISAYQNLLYPTIQESIITPPTVETRKGIILKR